MTSTRQDEKGKRFEFLTTRIDEAIDAGYFVEALSISYSLIEERTYQLLDSLGLSYGSDDKLFDCLKNLKGKIESRNITVTSSRLSQPTFIELLNETFIKSDLIDDMQIWRKKRNDVIHDLAKMDIDYLALEPIAIEGKRLFREYSAAIMRIKKQIH